MAELTWDELDKRFFERGVDRGVLSTPTAGVYSSGVAWNGLTAVTESPAGAESNKQTVIEAKPAAGYYFESDSDMKDNWTFRYKA